MRLHRWTTLPIAACLLTSSILLADETSDVLAFRKTMDEHARDAHGYLALVALQWLADGDTSVGAAAGNKLRLDHLPSTAFVVHQADGRAALMRPAGGFPECLTVDGKTAAAQTLVPDGSKAGDTVSCNGVESTVIERGDRLYLRVRDAQSPTLRAYHGLRWYPIKAGYRITGKWVPYLTGHELTFQNVLGQTFHEATPGYVEFQVDGRTVRLEPASVERDKLWFIFRDTTSKAETYGAGRFLYSALPSGGVSKPGSVVLDCNQAYNPPCAYTEFATCPLPSASNRLPVAIPAGEKRYHD